MKDKRIFKAITMISQVSISMMVPIFLCIYIGYQLDKKFSTNHWFLIFMVLGILASVRNVYYLTKGFYAKQKEQEDAELRYFEDLKKKGQESRK